MGVLQFLMKVVAAVVITAIGLFWSCFVIGSVVVKCFRKGFRNVLNWGDRRKEPPPFHYGAWDEKTRHSPGPSTTSWNHAYVTVPETDLRFHYVYSGKVPGHIAISDVDGETVMLSNGNKDDPDKPKLMICVHGYPENWFSWRHILRYFSDRDDDIGDYFVIALDMRGYGDSDIPESYKSYHMNCLVCDIKGVANALGYEKIVLVGHDWGGAITWRVAEIYPELTEKIIVLNAPHGKAMRDTIKQRPGQFLKSWYMFFFQIPYLPDVISRLSDFEALEMAFNEKNGGITRAENRLTKEELEVFKYSMRRSTAGPINYYRAALWPFAHPGRPLVYPRKTRDKDCLRKVPSLLLWGDQDIFLAKEIAVNTAKYLDTSIGSKICFVEGASHWVQQDNPKEVIRLMVDFLK